MNKRLSVPLLLFLFLFAGVLSSCSQDAPTLATSKIGNITRDAFYDWLEAKKVAKDTILDSKEKQISLLEKMALELFVVDKVRAEGFDRSRRLIAKKEQLKEKVLRKYFIRTLSDMASYDEPAIRVSYILLALNLYKEDPADNTKKIRMETHEVTEKLNALTSKAKEIIERLEEKEPFEKLATEYSDDTTKKNGGELGYITKSMMPAYFSDPAFNLEAGEYTKTPVMTPKGIYIIKVSEIVKLTEQNIDEIIEDKNQRDRTKVFLINQYRSEYLSRLMNADDVEFLIKEGETYTDTDTFFKVGTKEYMQGDIEKIFENRSTPEELEKYYKNGVLPEKTKFIIAKQLFSYLVWSREAIRLGVEKKPEYQKELMETEINLMMAEYLNAKLSNEIILSDQEIREEYESEKGSKYSEKRIKNGVVVNEPLPFEVVKDEVVEDLKEKTGRKLALEWRKQLFINYNFSINETELAGS